MNQYKKAVNTAIIFLLISGLCTACGANTDQEQAPQAPQGQSQDIENQILDEDGNGNGSGGGESGNSSDQNRAAPARDSVDYKTPDLDGITSSLSEAGMTLLRSEAWEEDGVTLGVFALENTEENTVQVRYTSDATFHKRTVYLATYDSVLDDMLQVNLQEDCTVYLWGEWSGEIFHAHTVHMLEFI